MYSANIDEVDDGEVMQLSFVCSNMSNQNSCESWNAKDFCSRIDNTCVDISNEIDEDEEESEICDEWYELNEVDQCVPIVEEPICEDTETIIFSDESFTVQYGSTWGFGSAVATYVHNAWAAISGATRIWSHAEVQNPTTHERNRFSKTFTIDGTPTTSILEIAADNGFIVWVNSAITDANAIIKELNENNFSTVQSHDITQYLVPGSNTITVEVRNHAQAGGTYQSNPAWVVLQLSVEAELCEEEEEPPVEVCTDSEASNEGQPLPCTYDPTPIDPEICDDESAINDWEEGECIHPPVDMCEIGTELMMNGGFEYPTVTANNGQWQIFTTWFDWIAERLSNGASELEFQAWYSNWAPYAGNQYVELDGNGSTKIYQDIETISGATYTVSYAFSPRPGTVDNWLLVTINGTTAATHSADGTWLSDTSRTSYNFTFVATGSTTRVAFTNTDVSDSYGTFLDGVSVSCSANPETDEEEEEWEDNNGNGNGWSNNDNQNDDEEEEEWEWDNNDGEVLWWGAGGWGWWGWGLTQDFCPEWDFSGSYYDGECGEAPVNGDGGGDLPTELLETGSPTGDWGNGWSTTDTSSPTTNNNVGWVILPGALLTTGGSSYTNILYALLAVMIAMMMTATVVLHRKQ